MQPSESHGDGSDGHPGRAPERSAAILAGARGISDEMVRAYSDAESRIWRTQCPTTQGEAAAVNREAQRAGLAAAEPHLRRAFIAELEAADSRLCDCPREDETPINPTTRASMDHHCDCAAVLAAATMHRSGAATVHASQCACDGPYTVGPPHGPDPDGVPAVDSSDHTYLCGEQMIPTHNCVGAKSLAKLPVDMSSEYETPKPTRAGCPGVPP